MNWPTSQDYNEAVQDAANSYSDPALKRGEVVTNALGLPVPRSGNFADVYQFKDGDGKMWALKCFTRKVPGLRERYAKIDEHLGRAKLPFTVGFKFMEQGIQVKGEWFPLLKMEWVEGFTLNDFVAENINKPQYLHALMQMWAKLAGRLRDANMAHADLQHGNVLLVPGATPQKLGLKLIDYDGMWVPALSDYHSGEVGHPNYQHPMRLKDKLYNGDVDRFPHLVVAAGLRATVVGGKAIWDRFDNGDNLLFKESDLRDPANAKVFKSLWELNDPVLRTLVGHIALSAKEPMRKTPWLDDILFEESGPKLTDDQEKRVCEMLGVSSSAPAVKSAAQAKVEQEFNVFEFLDDDDAEPARPRSKSDSRRPASKMVKRPKKEETKSKLPLFIGGGAVAAVLLIGGVIAAISLGGKKDKPTEVAKKEEERPIVPDGGIIPGKKDPDENVPVKRNGDGVDRALRFAGRGFVELQNSRDLVDLNGNFTVEAWVRWPANVNKGLTIMGDEAWRNMGTPLLVPNSCGWVLRTSGLEGGENRRIEFNVGADKGEWFSIMSPPVSAPGGEWHHFAVTKARDIVRIFLNGTPIAERNSGNFKFVSCPTDLYLGVRKDGYADRWFGGEFKAFRVSSRARYVGPFKPEEELTKDASTQVLLDFAGKAADTIADLSGKGRNGLLKDVQWVDIAKAAPPAGSPDTAAIGVAALPNGREFLLIRKGDPVLYMSDSQSGDQSGLKARAIGRHNSPIRAVAAASDGSRAITGGEDGEIRIWNLKESPEKKGEELGASLAKFKKIELFKERFSFDAYEEGIIVHDHEKNKDATVRVGKSGHPLKGVFKSNLDSKPEVVQRFGEALTDHVKVFDDELTVQVFEGGAAFFYPTVNKTWFGWHKRRKPLEKAPPESPKGLKDKVMDTKRMQGLNGDYEYTVYREGLLIREIKSGKEARILAGTRPGSMDGPFKASMDAPKSEFRDPVSRPTQVLGGALTVQLFRNGFKVHEKASLKDWNLSSTALFQETAGDQTTFKNKVSGPTKLSGFQRDFEFTLYREGIIIRDIKDKKEETLLAGPPVTELDGKFEGRFIFDRLTRTYGPPLTAPTKLFDGAIEIVLCRRGFFVNQVGTNRDWNMSGGKEIVGEPAPAKDAPPAKESKRADFVWIDDGLPTGAKPDVSGGNIPWEFSAKNDGPVHSGEKSIKLTVNGLQQNYFGGANPGLRVGADDVLFAHVYIDAKNPPEEIMVQWLGFPQGQKHARAYWGANKIEWEGKRMGDLPDAGKWVRLEMKIADIGIEPGTIIPDLALTQFGGTAYWDTIGLNTQTPQELGKPEAPKAPSEVTLKEHTAAIVACAISADGSRAVSIGKDKLLCEWNLAEGKLIRKFSVPDPEAIAYLPDGKSVVVGTATDSAGIWELEKQERVKQLEGHAKAVRAVVVSPKGDFAFTGGDEETVRAWRLPEWRLMGTYRRPQGVSAMAMSADGNMLAMTGPDGAARVYDPTNGKTLRSYTANSPGLSLAFINNGQELLVGRDAGPSIVRIQQKSGPASEAFTLLHESEPLNEGGGRIGFSRDGKLLFHSQKSSIMIVEAETGKPLNQIPFEGQFFDIALGAEKQLYIAMNDGKFQLWNWETGKVVKQVDFREMKQSPVMNINLTDDPDRLFVLTGSPFGFVWDVSEWKSSKRVQPYVNEGSLRGHMYPNGTQVVIQIGNATGGRLAVWDIAKSQHAFDIERVDAKGLSLSNIAVSPNGKWIVATTNDEAGKAFVWDAKTGKLSKTLTCVEARGLRGGFTAGGDHFIFQAGASRRVVVDLENDRIVDDARLRIPANGVMVASKASLMATVDADRRLRLWRIEIDNKNPAIAPKIDPKTPTPKEIAKEKEGLILESEVLSGAVLASSFSGDGNKIYVTTQSGTVHVLDAATLKETSKFEASKTALTHVTSVQKTPGKTTPERLYLLDEMRQVSAWDPEKGKSVKQWDLSKLTMPLKAVHRFVATPTDSFLMIFDNDAGTSVAFDVVSGTLRAPPGLSRPPFAGNTSCVAFTSDAKLGTAYASRKLLVWTVATGNPLRIIDASVGARWLGVVQDVHVVVAANINQLHAWNYTTGKKTLEISDLHGNFPNFHTAAPLKGGHVATAGGDQMLRVWDVASGKQLAQWRMEQRADGMAMSPDGKLAVAWHNVTNKVSLWSIPESLTKKAPTVPKN